MNVRLNTIPLREVLHFLGWRGAQVDENTLYQIQRMTELVLSEIQPRTVLLRRKRLADGRMEGTTFVPQGKDVQAMLETCHDTVLVAGTLGVKSERILLREQARDAAKAFLLDAVLSAGIEKLMDNQEEALRRQLKLEGLFLTDRFSPGYGDMPIAQTREICEVLNTQKTMGLTVSSSGIMIPRKSVTAVMGISSVPVAHRAKGCAVCEMRDTCALRKRADCEQE